MAADGDFAGGCLRITAVVGAGGSSVRFEDAALKMGRNLAGLNGGADAHGLGNVWFLEVGSTMTMMISLAADSRWRFRWRNRRRDDPMVSAVMISEHSNVVARTDDLHRHFQQRGFP